MSFFFVQIEIKKIRSHLGIISEVKHNSISCKHQIFPGINFIILGSQVYFLISHMYIFLDFTSRNTHILAVMGNKVYFCGISSKVDSFLFNKLCRICCKVLYISSYFTIYISIKSKFLLFKTSFSGVRCYFISLYTCHYHFI